MFDKQYRFIGTHAKMVSELTSIFDESSKVKIFNRNLDVYINAPLIGFLYKRKSNKNKDDDIAPQNIFPEQLIAAQEQLKYELRLILMLDADYQPDEEKRIDSAFRYLGKEEKDLELFDSYVLGGVEILHEKLIVNSRSLDDYIQNTFDFFEDFNDKFYNKVYGEEIVKKCINFEQED